MTITVTAKQLLDTLGKHMDGYVLLNNLVGAAGKLQDTHIFEGVMINGVWQPKTGKSLCGKVDYPAGKAFPQTPLDEDQARKEAARIGRPVCGQCVAALYSDNDS